MQADTQTAGGAFLLMQLNMVALFRLRSIPVRGKRVEEVSVSNFPRGPGMMGEAMSGFFYAKCVTH